MKKITCCLFGLICVPLTMFSQYCMLPGQTPYSNLQPGITNFKLNTINRTSGNSESASSVVVTTGLSTTLTAGQTYTISISHSEDSNFFQGDRNNLRVWIDYNSNFSYTDPNETVLSVDLQPPATTYTSTFTLPLATVAGTYHLRATAKMSIDAGHTLPTPCDNPADPIGYHGEMEDYTLIVQSAGGGQSPSANFQAPTSACTKAVITVTNNSTGTPAPSYSWSVLPAAGVTISPNNTAATPSISFANKANYTITCVATNSVSSSLIAKVVAVNSCTYTGVIDQERNEKFLMGPNPVTKILNISMGNEQPVTEISITNALGAQVVARETTFNPGTLSLDLSNLENGIYFINVTSDGRNFHRQIVLQK